MHRYLPGLLVAACLALSLTGCGGIMVRPSIKDDKAMAEAARNRPVLWKVPLGISLVEDMRFVGRGRILVMTRAMDLKLSNRDLMFLDADSGKVLWNHDRSKRKGGYSYVTAGGGKLVFSVHGKGETSLLALSAQDGAQAWSAGFKGPGTYFLPLKGGESLLAVASSGGSDTIRAIGLSNGGTLWQRVNARTASASPSPLTGPDGVYVFYQGVEKLSPSSGGSLWSRRQVKFSSKGPPPILAEGKLYIVDIYGKLRVLGARNGKEHLSSALPVGLRYTNVFPYGKHIYVRAMTGGKEPSSSRSFRLFAVDRRSGKVKWAYESAEPSVSNILEERGRVFFGTDSSLVALSLSGGREQFSKKVTDIGKGYPVKVASVGGKVVYISEMVVAGFDPATGRRAFRHGTTPLSPGTYLYGLDLKIQKAEASGAKARPSSGGMTGYYLDAAIRYQNESSRFFKLASIKRSKGDYLGASLAATQGEMNAAWAEMDSNLAFHSAMQELGEVLGEYLRELFKAAELRKNKFLRRSIIAAFSSADLGRYVFRPHGDDNLSGVSVFDLKTGKRIHTNLSASYEDYGIWNLLDTDKGIAYHHGIGLDPSGYVFEQGTINKFIAGYLIAQPVNMP